MLEQVITSLQSDLADVCGHINAQHARLVRLTQVALREKAWAQIGVLSPSHWLAWQTGVSAATARKILSVAERADAHPRLMAAFDAGELSLDQIAVAIKAPSYTDAEMCGLATMLTVTQISRIVRQYPFEPEPAGGEPDTANEPESEAAAGEESSVSLWVDDDGTGQVRASLAADHYRVVEAALGEARDALFQAGQPDVGWVDALVEVANRSLDTVTVPSRRDRFRINMYVHADRPERTVTFADNWRVPDALRDLLLCDATVTPIYVVDGVPVSVGRAQHIVPERTRRTVEHRDLGCRVPGCNQSRWVQVHHIIHYGAPDNGPTDTWNLICLCPRHHRMHHRGKLGITGNADLAPGAPGAVEFTDERGRTIPPGAAPTAPGAPPPSPTGRYQHPLGERLDPWAVHFNPPRPTNADNN